MALESVGKAMQDAGIKYEQVQEATVGYVYGKSKLLLHKLRVISIKEIRHPVKERFTASV